MKLLTSILGLVLAAAALVALAPGAAAQCTSSSTTTDLGVAQVTQYDAGCSYNWGDYGYEFENQGVGATSGDASVNAELWKYHSWGSWGSYGYDDVTRWASVYGTVGDKNVQLDAGAELYHYKAGDAFCIDYVYGFVYAPPNEWGGWWGTGPGNNALPPVDTGFWLGAPCTGALPLPQPPS